MVLRTAEAAAAAAGVGGARGRQARGDLHAVAPRQSRQARHPRDGGVHSLGGARGRRRRVAVLAARLPQPASPRRLPSVPRTRHRRRPVTVRGGALALRTRPERPAAGFFVGSMHGMYHLVMLPLIMVEWSAETSRCWAPWTWSAS